LVCYFFLFEPFFKLDTPLTGWRNIYFDIHKIRVKNSFIYTFWFILRYMKNNQVWIALNISLSLIAVILILTFFDIELPSVGKTQYFLNKEQPSCIVNWQSEFTSWNDFNRCCLEARKQLECIKEERVIEGKEVHWRCQTGSGKVLAYWLNNKAYLYCQQQTIWK
jgi:hypothetical protein